MSRLWIIVGLAIVAVLTWTAWLDNRQLAAQLEDEIDQFISEALA